MLKIKQTSDVKWPLTIAETKGADGKTIKCEIMVRRLGPQQAKELQRRCTRPKLNPETRAMEDVLDDELWMKTAPEYYIDAAECAGFTPDVFAHLGIELEEAPAVDANGQVPVTPELLVELWENADADRFVRPIIAFSRRMLTASEAAKKNASMG